MWLCRPKIYFPPELSFPTRHAVVVRQSRSMPSWAGLRMPLPPCLFLQCLSRLCTQANRSLQTWQVCVWIPRCTLACACILLTKWLLIPQILQLKSFGRPAPFRFCRCSAKCSTISSIIFSTSAWVGFLGSTGKLGCGFTCSGLSSLSSLSSSSSSCY